jgi:tight adherence protein C
MTGLSWLVIIAPFACVAFLTYGVAVLLGRRRAVKDRIMRASTAATVQLLPRVEKSGLKKRFLDWVSSVGKYGMDEKEDSSKLRALLIQAGYRHPKGPAIYFGLRVLTAVALPLPYLIFSAWEGKMAGGGIFMLFSISAAGFYLPHFLLRFATSRRQDRIDKALPDVLDLLIVCMEAGLALQATINRVSEEVRTISLDLYKELHLLNAELRTGIPRELALKNLGERTGVQNVKALVGLMVQSEKMGTSISQAMRTHASFLRTQRAHRAEEKAAKLPVKILFPMLLFIFPSIFIIVMGPALLQVNKMGIFK